MASSLEHLDTDHVDSYVLHGPASGHGWTEYDAEVWGAMGRERDAGRTRALGVSNVSLRHLQQMAATGAEMPAFVQNRCFAVRGWDRDVRAFCAPRRIVYQGFSLLTANPDVLRHPLVTGIAARSHATPAQVVFRFAVAVGMLLLVPLPPGPIDGLGLRWSFMGPFETIDLNAAGGIAEYARLYGRNLQQLVVGGSYEPLADKVIAVVAAERRAILPTGGLGQRQAWRDTRLAQLVAHKAAADGDVPVPEPANGAG